MLNNTETFSSFAVRSLDEVRSFYAETLGLKTSESDMGLLNLHLAGDRNVMIYPKPDYIPATFTVLNFRVTDLDAAVVWMTARGVEFERYPEFEMDDKGIHREQNVAWFKDPAGNILAVMLGPGEQG